MMSKFLKPATKEKIKVCKLEEALKVLRERCDPETVARLEAYMANRREASKAKQIWHPVVDLPWFRERLKDMALDGDTKQWLTADDRRRFREALREWRAEQWEAAMMRQRSVGS